MSLDFSGKNLQGRSFQGQDLTGADFSYTDIRGCNFTDAILKDANFSHAKAGLEIYWQFFLHLVSFLLAAISGAAARFAGGIAAAVLTHNSLIYQSFPTLKIINLAIVLTILAVLFLFIARRGITNDLVGFLGVLTAALILFGGLAGVFYLAGIDTQEVGLRLLMRVAWDLAGTLPWGVAGAMSVSLAEILYFWNSNFWNSKIISLLDIAEIIILIGIWAWTWDIVKEFFSHTEFTVVTAVAIAVILLGSYIAWHIFAEDKRFTSLRSIIIAFAANKGTNFYHANLTDANFSQANLKHTYFRSANLTRTNFHKAKNLELARVGNTILINAQVRDLLVSKRGTNKFYRGCNLKGANLAGADISYADLVETNISEATFFDANLEGANLTKTQALHTNFQQARLTAACLEAWNIDSTTQLAGTICDYVYLLNNQRERRPSSGNFAPGEFTKLFQEVLHTVDIILRNGLSLPALAYSLQQLKIENEGTELSIRSIENLGDGVILVRVNIPAEASKEKIHAEFTQYYENALKALEENYKSRLKSKDKQIEEWKEFAHLLASRPVNIQVNQTTETEKNIQGKLVVLKIGKGDFNTGFPVTLQISREETFPSVECTGELSSDLHIPKLYNQWQSAYCRSFNLYFRLDVPATQITNISRNEFFEECTNAAENLRKHLNLWLNSENFRPVKERMLEKLNANESIRIILQTENSLLRRLPWTVWDLCDRYPKAEIALSSPTYDHVESSVSRKTKVRILAILGNSTGIDIQKDQTLLQNLPDAEVKFLVEPQRQQLNDELWAQPWDILFFAGHSSTQADREIGQIYINKTDSLTILQLKHALRKAIEQGLQLAIFNSCDGLGLAVNLADLHIPQIIVMREPVPDKVAQEFLKNFLTEFSRGKPLYQSVREAREKLQGLEDRFPCASWLPVICQNPAEVPPTWEELGRRQGE